MLLAVHKFLCMCDICDTRVENNQDEMDRRAAVALVGKLNIAVTVFILSLIHI